MKNSYLGCLIGAAAGDAMGAASEIRTREEIVRDFNGYITGFEKPPLDTFAGGRQAGQVTDDFSFAYYACNEILERGGEISDETAHAYVFKWFNDSQYNRFCGPTTKASILALKGENQVQSAEDRFIHNNGRATNGAGMKASPIALFSGGDVDKAISIAMTMTKVTHPNNISLSGAGAIAAATARAMQENSSVLDILDAGLYGAKEGDKYGRNIQTLAGPSIYEIIKLAAQIGVVAEDVPHAIVTIGDVIGSGLIAAQAIPAVFGIIIASRGDAVKGILGGVNIGDDTDTVATMVGGILGAFQGSDVFPKDYLLLLDKENGFNLSLLANKILETVQ